MKSHWVGIFLLVVLQTDVQAQIPTNQDCLGAIPICSPIYFTSSATFGSGNYPNEHPPVTCLVPGEYNSLWFIFTVISSGNLAFEIIPVSPFADYDWALYNLTNATCADIKTNSALSVSCNSSQYGYTGISATGVGNWNGPGPTNAFNYLYPVNAGETYVLNVNNWSGTTGGYTLNFSNSTATIFDSVKPKLASIVPPACLDNSITFSFSEKVLCASVSTADFALTGPGGPYSILSVTGPACAVGGAQELTFTATFFPPLTTGGLYQFSLTQNGGSVEDLCGNLADTTTMTFSVNGVLLQVDSIVQPSCGGNNGAIYTSANGGTPPYQFFVNGMPSATGVFTGLDGGTYVLTATDAAGCSHSLSVTLSPSTGPVVGQVLAVQQAQCPDSCNASIWVTGSGGHPPYNYTWSNGQNTNILSQLCAGIYSVVIADLFGCSDTLHVTVTEPPPVFFSIDSLRHVSCYGRWDGYVDVSLTGGTPGYWYQWIPYGGNLPWADHLNANHYQLHVTDAAGCHYSFAVNIGQPDPLVIEDLSDQTVCLGDSALLFVPVAGGTPPYQVLWTNGSSANPYLIWTTTDTFLRVVAVDAMGCQSDTASATLTVILPIELDLGADTVLCLGDVLEKNVSIPNAWTVWQDGSIQSFYRIERPGMYYVTVQNACFSASDTVQIAFDDCTTCLTVPNAFTPNGDGINDWFLPHVHCTLEFYEFTIFNRWGQQVFTTTQVQQGWDGARGTQLMETGTYVWHIRYRGSKHNVTFDRREKGYVVLLR